MESCWPWALSITSYLCKSGQKSDWMVGLPFWLEFSCCYCCYYYCFFFFIVAFLLGWFGLCFGFVPIFHVSIFYIDDDSSFYNWTHFETFEEPGGAWFAKILNALCKLRHMSDLLMKTSRLCLCFELYFMKSKFLGKLLFTHLNEFCVHFICRANAQQPKLFVGMILILIFAEALALYGLSVGIILSSRAGQSRAD